MNGNTDGAAVKAEGGLTAPPGAKKFLTNVARLF